MFLFLPSLDSLVQRLGLHLLLIVSPRNSQPGRKKMHKEGKPHQRQKPSKRKKTRVALTRAISLSLFSPGNVAFPLAFLYLAPVAFCPADFCPPSMAISIFCIPLSSPLLRIILRMPMASYRLALPSHRVSNAAGFLLLAPG